MVQRPENVVSNLLLSHFSTGLLYTEDTCAWCVIVEVIPDLFSEVRDESKSVHAQSVQPL